MLLGRQLGAQVKVFDFAGRKSVAVDSDIVDTAIPGAFRAV